MQCRPEALTRQSLNPPPSDAGVIRRAAGGDWSLIRQSNESSFWGHRGAGLALDPPQAAPGRAASAGVHEHASRQVEVCKGARETAHLDRCVECASSSNKGTEDFPAGTEQQTTADALQYDVPVGGALPSPSSRLASLLALLALLSSLNFSALSHPVLLTSNVRY
ncbi:hypothetical protein NDU88_002329 [Pleurodeles waltl]|uniref:Uncharacterized protein n=1 Tax=Pleurodeles waltl TaxID=8319 RepID=A0AAV7MNF9_PLEWA|nr:hypothetical protein NDU88_002329 [Pleurodeles waltl]